MRLLFQPVFSLAGADSVSSEELAALDDVTLQSERRPEVPWMVDLFTASREGRHDPAEWEPDDLIRRASLRVLARAVELHGAEGGSFEEVLRSAVAFGDQIDVDPVLSSIEQSQGWRGVLLRHYSVGAWRRLWAALVASIGGEDGDADRTREELRAWLADQLDDIPVGTVLDELGPLQDSSGHPPGECASRETMTGRSTIRPSRSSPSLVLLGALVHGNGLEVTLARPQPVDVRIDSSPDGSPQSWRAVGVIPAGEVNLLLTVPEAPGSVIRAVMRRTGIGVVESPPVFAVSPARCAPRVAGNQEPRLRREYTVEELFTDPALARRFTADLAQLAEILPRGVRVRPAAGNGDGVTAGSSIEDRWTAHLEECGRIFGTSFTGLIYGSGASGLPDSSRLSRWNPSSRVKDEEAEEEGAQEGADASGEPELADRPLYRQWAVRWADVVTRRDTEPPPLPMRMLIAGIYVKLLAAGLWRLPDDSWREPLGRLAQALVPGDGDNAPVESRGRLCAVIATCVALLCQDASLTGGETERPPRRPCLGRRQVLDRQG
ncbi:hypothetical protein [Streptosporangium saharense]|uniref:hypothetical protein n=1 Tax=Streptosporangium saharense TaxID=1706840 RepID=UPI00331E0629